MADFPSDLPPNADIPLDSSTIPEEEIPLSVTHKCTSKPKKRGVLRIIGVVGAGTVLCPAIVHYGRIWVPRLWSDPHAVNFFAAWIPAVLSILVAFIPDRELEMKRRVAWRSVVIFCGVFYSVILFRQQVLTDESNATTNGKLLSDAVTSANAHSDLQFGKVQTKVGDLGGKVESVGKKTEALGDALAKAAGDINTNLGKVGKPDPTPPPKIVFTFTDTPSNPNDPLRSETIKPNEDGTYSFKFNAVNNSDIIAEQVEAWVSICKVCEFVGEPKGSDHPPGEIAQMRHFVFGSMNAGVAHGDTSVTFKVTPTTVHAPFGVTFAYACKTCNKPHHEPDYILNVDYSSPPTKQP